MMEAGLEHSINPCKRCHNTGNDCDDQVLKRVSLLRIKTIPSIHTFPEFFKTEHFAQLNNAEKSTRIVNPISMWNPDSLRHGPGLPADNRAPILADDHSCILPCPLTSSHA